jgi:hypothetical protein
MAQWVFFFSMKYAMTSMMGEMQQQMPTATSRPMGMSLIFCTCKSAHNLQTLRSDIHRLQCSTRHTKLNAPLLICDYRKPRTKMAFLLLTHPGHAVTRVSNQASYAQGLRRIHGRSESF